MIGYITDKTINVRLRGCFMLTKLALALILFSCMSNNKSTNVVMGGHVEYNGPAIFDPNVTFNNDPTEMLLEGNINIADCVPSAKAVVAITGFCAPNNTEIKINSLDMIPGSVICPCSNGQYFCGPVEFTGNMHNGLSPLINVLNTSFKNSSVLENGVINVCDNDLKTHISVSDLAPAEGDTLVYTISSKNFGPGNITNVQLKNLLPDELIYQSANTVTGSYDSSTGIWDIGDIADSSVVTLDIIVKVATGLNGMSITNEISDIKLDQIDGSEFNDVLDVMITVLMPPFVEVNDDVIASSEAGQNSSLNIATNDSANSTCTPVSYTFGTCTNCTRSGSAPNVTINPSSAGAWNVSYTATCIDGTTDDTASISGSADPAPAINAVNDVVASSEAGQNSSLNIATNDSANSTCTPVSYTFGTCTNCTRSGSAPNVTINPSAAGAWNVSYTATCIGGLTNDSASISGNAEAISTPDANLTITHSGSINSNFSIRLAAYLSSTPTNLALDTNDEVRLQVNLSQGDTIDVTFTVGSNPLTTYSGNNGTISWAAMAGCSSSSTSFNANNLLNNNYILTFDKRCFAISQGSSLDLIGVNKGSNYNVQFNSKDVSKNLNSPIKSAIINKLYGMFNTRSFGSIQRSSCELGSSNRMAHYLNLRDTYSTSNIDPTASHRFTSSIRHSKNSDPFSMATMRYRNHPTNSTTYACLKNANSGIDNYSSIFSLRNYFNYWWLPNLNLETLKVSTRADVDENAFHTIRNYPNTAQNHLNVKTRRLNNLAIHIRSWPSVRTSNMANSNLCIGRFPGSSASSGSNRTCWQTTGFNNSDSNSQSIIVQSSYTFPSDGKYYLYGRILQTNSDVHAEHEQMLIVYSF